MKTDRILEEAFENHLCARPCQEFFGKIPKTTEWNMVIGKVYRENSPIGEYSTLYELDDISILMPTFIEF